MSRHEQLSVGSLTVDTITAPAGVMEAILVGDMTAEDDFTVTGGLTAATVATPSLAVGTGGTALGLVKRISATITPTQIAAADTPDVQTFTFTGVAAGDYVLGLLAPAAHYAQAMMSQAVVSDADEVTIKFHAHTTLTPTAGEWTVLVARVA